MIKELIKTIKEMSKFEKLFSMVFITILIAIQVITGSSGFAFVTALFGMFYGITVKYGLRIGLLFGVIQTFSYTFMAFTNGVYGDFILNSISCCILLIGFVFYNKIGKKDDTKGSRWLTKPQKIITVFVFIGIYTIMVIILSKLGSYKVYVDAVNSTCSIIALILMNMKFLNCWGWWTLCNTSSLALYILALIDGKPVLPVVCMFFMFLLNSVHGQIINNNKKDL